MSLRDAAQKALEALRYIHTETTEYQSLLIDEAIKPLRAALAADALQRLTDEQQMIERGNEPVTDRHDLEQARAIAVSNLLTHFGIASTNADVNVAYLHKQLDDFLTISVGRSKEGDRLSPPLDAPETNFRNMAQGVDFKEADHIADTYKMVASINKMETVEPVAYVTGYRDGFCVINPVEHAVFPTGMALYMSPPTSQESRQVEPVAYCTLEQLTYLKLAVPSDDKIPLYPAPPKREPLTPQEIQECVAEVDDARLAGPITALIRAVERKLGIGDEA